MSVATYEAVIENGQIKLPQDIRLPEQARVYVVVPSHQQYPIVYLASPRLVHPGQAADFQKEVVEEESDA